MLPRFFNIFPPSRKELSSDIDDKVTVYCWGQTLIHSTKHVALEVKKGTETHYLSFSPESSAGLDSLSIMQMREGRAGLFRETFEDENLVYAFVDTKQVEEKTKGKNFYQELEMAKHLPESEQKKLIERGAPEQKIVLRSLDVNKMIQRIKTLKQKMNGETESKSPSLESKFAPWSSAFYHNKNTYNCSSIVLDVLYAGGLEELIQNTFHSILGKAGMLLGIFSFFNGGGVVAMIWDMFKGYVVGSTIGGVYEGWTDAQSMVDLMHLSNVKKQKQDSGLTVLGLRMASMLFTSIVSLIKSGPIIPEYLYSTPQTVIERAMQAKRKEDEIYVPQLR